MKVCIYCWRRTESAIRHLSTGQALFYLKTYKVKEPEVTVIEDPFFGANDCEPIKECPRARIDALKLLTTLASFETSDDVWSSMHDGKDHGLEYWYL